MPFGMSPVQQSSHFARTARQFQGRFTMKPKKLVCATLAAFSLLTLPLQASHAALLSDRLKITDQQGNVLTDMNGTPADVSLVEGGIENIPPISFNAPQFDPTLGNPSPQHHNSLSIILTEKAPDGSCLPPNGNTPNPQCSDAVTVSLIYNTGGPATLQIGLQSDFETPFTGNLAAYQPVAEVMESGTLADITTILTSAFAGTLYVTETDASGAPVNIPIRVLVMSDSDAPEPVTMALLASGLTLIGAFRRRETSPR
jgi:hypothetical protein